MKKFLKNFSLVAMFALLVSFTAQAQTWGGDLQMNRYTARLARLGVNVDISTNTQHSLNVLGDTKLTSRGTTPTVVICDSLKIRATGRFSTPFGTSVASANNISMPYNGSKVQVTGTTTVNLIDTTGFVGGDEIQLWFNGSLTVADSVARSGVYAPINLAGGSNFSATKNDQLTLCFRREPGMLASEWWECGRTVNAD